MGVNGVGHKQARPRTRVMDDRAAKFRRQQCGTGTPCRVARPCHISVVRLITLSRLQLRREVSLFVGFWGDKLNTGAFFIMFSRYLVLIVVRGMIIG